MNKYDMNHYHFRANEAVVRAHKRRVRISMGIALVLAIVEWIR